MITIRYKPLKSGKFSVYLDIYSTENQVREYKFLNIYVTQDYSKIKRIKEIDQEHIDSANAIKGKMELFAISDEASKDLSITSHNLTNLKGINVSIHPF